MLTLFCRNCGARKEVADYANNYCISCDANVKLKVDEAIKTGGDVSEARREGLAERAHSSHASTPDPRILPPRVDTAALDARLSIEPGSIGDPRRGR